MNKNGMVYLIGAGPGSPDLITVKGFELIKSADVILYDKLANPQLLSYCKNDAEKIFVGKEAGLHHVKQDKIIEILIDKAAEGKKVVRLKGGDPYIFGRGSEEAMALHQAGIDFEIVPGITAATGAAAYAGIPLTHRNLVTQTILITAHEAPDKEESQVEWERLAKMKHTSLVIYMGAAMLPKIVETLIDFGMAPDTPSAVIENGTMPYQRSLTSKLSELPDIVESQGFRPPLITVISPTIDLIDELKWLERKPLFGKRIVTTRAQDQAQSLHDLLSSLGAWVIPFQMLRTEFSQVSDSIKSVLNAKDYDWLIFSSENGVRYFFEKMKIEGLDARALAKSKIAAIGSGTARQLQQYNIIADFIPEKFTSQALLEELPEKENISGKSILRIKGDFEKDLLSDGLQKHGAFVTTYESYKIIKDNPDESIIEDIKKNSADAFLFTSTSTVNNFFELLGNDEAKRLLTNSLPLAIGPVTLNTLKEKNIDNAISSEVHTIDGMAEALITYWNK